MALTSDTLLERLQLKRQVTFWRVLTLLVIAIFGVTYFEHARHFSPIGEKFIARVTIDGMILDDEDRDQLLRDIADDKNIKAVLVRIDSPGGTAVGGETLFHYLQTINDKKPVIALCRTMCTSAGYMTAIAAQRIYAQESSITGSIGVLLQSAEFTGLADKLGITPITIKSGINKAAPSPTEKLDPEQRAVLQSAINDFYHIFVGMVAKARGFKPESMTEIADGRIFTGRQALSLKLIDAIGDEQDAVDWLEKEKKIEPDLDIVDMEVEHDDKTLLEKLSSWSGANFLSQNMTNHLDGLLLLWQPVRL